MRFARLILPLSCSKWAFMPIALPKSTAFSFSRLMSMSLSTVFATVSSALSRFAFSLSVQFSATRMSRSQYSVESDSQSLPFRFGSSLP